MCGRRLYIFRGSCACSAASSSSALFRPEPSATIAYRLKPVPSQRARAALERGKSAAGPSAGAAAAAPPAVSARRKAEAKSLLRSMTAGSAAAGGNAGPSKGEQGDLFVMNKKEFSTFLQETRLVGGGLSRAAADLVFIIGNREQSESGRFVATNSSKHKRFQFFQFLQCLVRMAFLRYPNLPSLRQRFRTMMEQLLMPNARMDADALAMASAEVAGALRPFRQNLRDVYRRWAHLEYVDLEQRTAGRFGVRVRQERWRMTFSEFYNFSYMHDLAADEEEAGIPEDAPDRFDTLSLAPSAKSGKSAMARRAMAGRPLRRAELVELFLASLPDASVEVEMESLGAVEGLHDGRHTLPFREFEEARARPPEPSARSCLLAL
eukprot:tig00001479_g8905.t1